MPWRYATQRPDERKDASVVHVKGDLSFAKVTNISGTSGMTCSGRIFTAPEPPVWSKDPKGKAKAGVEESDKVGLVPDDEVPAGRFAKATYVEARDSKIQQIKEISREAYD